MLTVDRTGTNIVRQVSSLPVIHDLGLEAPASGWKPAPLRLRSVGVLASHVALAPLHDLHRVRRRL